MPDQVAIFYETKGLDSLIKALKEVGKPSFRVIAELEGVLAEAFEDTQIRTHVISGRLKSSGYPESHFTGSVWSATINYGGPTGTPAYYAIYEMSRGGSRPDGTPHDFFAGLDGYVEQFDAVIDKHFEILRRDG